MDRKAFLKIEVYLKNGCVVDEYLDEDEEETIDSDIKELKDRFSSALKTKFDFSIVLGDTVFRGEDISAVTLRKAFKSR